MTLVRDSRTIAAPSGEANNPKAATPYETDGCAWAIEQAALLRSGRVDLIDVGKIADEIDAVGTSESRATRSANGPVLRPLVKGDFQADRRNRSRVLSIRERRRAVDRQSRDDPGLRSATAVMLDDACADARDAALAETGLPEAAIPLACPYSWDAIMTRPIEGPEQP